MILPNNLGRQFSLNASEYEAKAVEVLRSGWYILGKEVIAFEEEWASYIGSKYCVGLASGLDALWMSFRLLDIKEGDEVKEGDVIAVDEGSTAILFAKALKEHFGYKGNSKGIYF